MSVARLLKLSPLAHSLRVSSSIKSSVYLSTNSTEDDDMGFNDMVLQFSSKV